jgi:hypothetical protein
MSRGAWRRKKYPIAISTIDPTENAAPNSLELSPCVKNITQPSGKNMIPEAIKVIPAILQRSGISLLTTSSGGVGSTDILPNVELIRVNDGAPRAPDPLIGYT